MSKFVETEFGGTKEILKFPDHYVALAVMVSDIGVAARPEDGKKIVPKGAIVGGRTKSVLEYLDEPVANKFAVVQAASLLTGDDVDDDNVILWAAKAAGAAGNDITIAYVNARVPTSVIACAVATKAITLTLKNTTAVLASATTGVEGSNNGLTWTSKLPGVDGNDIVVVLQDPAGNNQALAITVTGKTIMVSLATGEAGAITTTALALKAAIEATPAAHALVAVTHTGASTGAVAVVDEIADLADGDDGEVESTAAEVVAKVAATTAAAALVAGEVQGEGDGEGVVEPMAATNLAGGSDAATGAEGILKNDVDVTYGPKEGAMIIHGFVKLDALPYAADNALIPATIAADAAAARAFSAIKFIK